MLPKKTKKKQKNKLQIVVCVGTNCNLGESLNNTCGCSYGVISLSAPKKMFIA
jgi:hypothetical protein